MEKTFLIKNLDCAHCGGKIEEAIGKMDGVESAVLNFPLKKIKVKGNITDELLVKMNELAKSIEAEVEIVPAEVKHEIKEISYTIKNLDCAHCGGKIEEAIGKMDGVESAVLNFPLKKIKVKGNITDELLVKMNKLAKSIEAEVEIVESEHDDEHKHSHDEECDCCHEHDHDEHSHNKSDEHHEHSHGEKGLNSELITLIIGLLFFVAATILSKIGILNIISLIIYICAYIVLGHGVLTTALKNIKNKNFFDENTLMTVATIGAFIVGEYPEAVGVMLFFKIGELFEDYAVEKSRKAITDVAELKVDEADVLVNGEYKRISADRIKKGDILRIKVGERIAADGIVESGESRIDTSAINGEPVPVSVHAGDKIMSGCINLSEVFTLKATASADESMISKIARAVEDASAEKPKIDRFITRFSKIYTPVVLVIALLTAVIGSVITGEVQKWVYSALTFLVISCPCALVLSVPLAYFSGIGAASKLGILFKGGNAIEALAKIKAVAFDKTGTLTNGSFTVTEVKSYGKLEGNELLRICGSCEQASTHPVAESITASCKEKGLTLENPEKSAELSGRGIVSLLNGNEVLCGNEKLMNEKGITIPESEKSSFGSVVFITVNGKIEGRITVSDTVKDSSAKAVAELKAMGIHTAMLTGDSKSNADAVGNKIGIDYISSELMPDGKLEEIGKIREKNGAVMFIGDGINDGPVLAGADVGGAMQTGSDLALEAADAVFMNSEPDSVVKAKKISDKAYRVSYQNIVFALAVKAIVLILGIIGRPSMWFAVFADSGTAMLLVLNSIRVLNTRQYRK